MNHNFIVEGYSYRIRPVCLEDSKTIIKIRLEDCERNQYIHKVSEELEPQKKWIEEYFRREGDYYFLVENRLTNKPEGLIGIYNIEGKKGEWGRWVIKKDSLAALESVNLIIKFAFLKLGLEEIYCRTIAENETVVSFHDSIGLSRIKILKNEFTLNERIYDAVLHSLKKGDYISGLENILNLKCIKIHERNLRYFIRKLEFHHIGVATKNIEKELASFSLLGYKKHGESFDDFEQGIRGQFIKSNNQPMLELLENLDGSYTLSPLLEKSNKLYHFSYLVDDFDELVKVFVSNRGKIISYPKISQYFKKRICFVLLPNMFIIELIER